LAQKLRPYISWTDEESIICTPFGRLKAIWKTAYPPSLETISKTGHVWHPNGQSFDLFRRGLKIFVSLADLKHAARVITASSMTEIIKLAGGDPVCEGTLMSFDIRLIRDDPTSNESFIRTEAATEVFAPMRSELWEQLKANGLMGDGGLGRINKQKAEAWLSQDEVALETILTSFSLTCGITPRPCQTRLFTFKKHGDTIRNLYIIGQYVVIAFPKPKNRTKGDNRGPGLWVLPVDLAKPLLLYLGVIRPLSISILDKLGRSHSHHDTHIFVHNKKGKNEPWDGSHINAIVRTRLAGAIDLSADALDLRQIMQMIAKKHFPFLLDLPRNVRQQTSPLNSQADHTEIISFCNYAVGKVRTPSSFGFSSERSDRYFLVSHTFQAAFGMAGVPQKLKACLAGLHIHVDEENRRVAMDRARFLICREYRILEGSVKENVKNVSYKKPFLFGMGALQVLVYSPPSWQT
jgi:hypothetical protein